MAWTQTLASVLRAAADMVGGKVTVDLGPDEKIKLAFAEEETSVA